MFCARETSSDPIIPSKWTQTDPSLPWIVKEGLTKFFEMKKGIPYCISGNKLLLTHPFILRFCLLEKVSSSLQLFVRPNSPVSFLNRTIPMLFFCSLNRPKLLDASRTPFERFLPILVMKFDGQSTICDVRATRLLTFWPEWVLLVLVF